MPNTIRSSSGKGRSIPRKSLQLMENERITRCQDLSPTMLHALLQSPNIDKYET